jgi:hypothetical protein
VQREQPADVVHIFIVQLGQHLVDHALREGVGNAWRVGRWQSW